MEELVKIFHIDWKLLIAQIVNFAVVVWVLYRFALKPLMKILEKRNAEISKSLDDAKQIEANLMMSTQEKANLIAAAKKEANAIIEASRTDGSRQAQELLEKAKNEVNAVVASARQQIAEEKEKMLAESRKEIGELVIDVTDKVLRGTLNKEVDKDLIAKSLTDLDK
jgi:F-type H+-transporting ATPase subunit b